MSNPTPADRFEVELKFRAADHSDLTGRLRTLGAIPSESALESDIYLAHPARDFAKSGEVLRLRAVGHAVVIAYKGPKSIGAAKTREEIEIPCIASPDTLDSAQSLFARLGFHPVATVAKQRQTWSLAFHERPITVMLDSVAKLGPFAEVEAIAHGRDDIPNAEAAVVELARQLGLDHPEPRSYLRLWLEAHPDSAGQFPQSPL